MARFELFGLFWLIVKQLIEKKYQKYIRKKIKTAEKCDGVRTDTAFYLYWHIFEACSSSYMEDMLNGVLRFISRIKSTNMKRHLEYFNTFKQPAGHFNKGKILHWRLASFILTFEFVVIHLLI